MSFLLRHFYLLLTVFTSINNKPTKLLIAKFHTVAYHQFVVEQHLYITNMQEIIFSPKNSLRYVSFTPLVLKQLLAKNCFGRCTRVSRFYQYQFSFWASAAQKPASLLPHKDSKFLFHTTVYLLPRRYTALHRTQYEATQHLHFTSLLIF